MVNCSYNVILARHDLGQRQTKSLRHSSNRNIAAPKPNAEYILLQALYEY